MVTVYFYVGSKSYGSKTYTDIQAANAAISKFNRQHGINSCATII